MATVDPIQTAFNGGELSPRLRGRVESDIYKRGLEYDANWELPAQGSLKRRPGTRFAAPGAGGVLKAFPVPGRHGYVLEFGEKTLTIRSADGLIESNGSILEDAPENWLGGGNFKDDSGWSIGYLPGWQTTEDSYYVPPSVTFDCEDEPMVSVHGLTGRCAFLRKMTCVRNTFTVMKAGTLRLHFKVKGFSLTYYGGSPLFRVRIFRPDGNILSQTIDPARMSSGQYYKDLLYTFEAEVATTGLATIQFEVIGSIPRSDGWGDGWICFTDVMVEQSTAPITLTTPWTLEEAAELQTVMDTDSNVMLLFHQDVKPYKLAYCPNPLPYDSAYGANAPGALIYGACTPWTLAAAVFTGQPTDWAEKSWPSVCEVYQGRLWVGGVSAKPQTFWASASGNLYDFTIPATAEDIVTSSPFSFRLGSKGVIHWMSGRQSMLIGTDRGAVSVTAQGVLISTADIDIREESVFGGAPIQADAVGGEAIYISPDRRKLRGVEFSLQRQAWLPKDVTFIAEHMTRGFIKSFVYLPDPDGVLVVLCDDGSVACCNYDREQGVAAWWRMGFNTEAPHGLPASMCTTSGPEGSVLWFSVQRGTVYSVEWLSFLEGDLTRHCDCAQDYTVADGVQSFQASTRYCTNPDGLSVLVNGAHDPGATIATGSGDPTRQGTAGEITLSQPVDGASTVTVGFAFNAKAITLPPEIGGRRGTAQVGVSQWGLVKARLADSAIPEINGQRAPERRPSTPMDENTPLVTEDATYNVLGGEEFQGRLTIEQSLPLRTEVVALFGVLGNEEM